MGLNIATGYTEKLISLNVNNVDTMYDSLIEFNSSARLSLVFLKINNKYYTTGNQSLMFGDNVLQKSWKKIADNVAYFQPKYSAYVDKDGELWIAGDSRKCGLGEESKEYKVINNYIKCTDVNIAGKVKEVNSCKDVTYVLTKDNELWATGRYYDDAGNLEYPGWSEAEDKINFVKILENVKLFSIGTYDDYLTKIAFSTDGKAYVWGENDNGLGIGSVRYNVPTEFTFPTVLKNVDNISYWLQTGSFRNFCITKEGKTYISGSWYHMFAGGNTVGDGFTEYTYGINLGNEEQITKVVNQNVKGAMFLTNKGNIFGYGPGKTLGIGNTTDDNLNCQAISGIKDVEQIVSGNGWYVAIKKDGTVWGTGSNTYGILGRWIGIDRNTPNSRYKTAFEWVECPELEI